MKIVEFMVYHGDIDYVTSMIYVKKLIIHVIFAIRF